MSDDHSARRPHFVRVRVYMAEHQKLISTQCSLQAEWSPCRIVASTFHDNTLLMFLLLLFKVLHQSVLLWRSWLVQISLENTREWNCQGKGQEPQVPEVLSPLRLYLREVWGAGSSCQGGRGGFNKTWKHLSGSQSHLLWAQLGPHKNFQYRKRLKGTQSDVCLRFYLGALLINIKTKI